MSASIAEPPTIADLLRELGGVSPQRIRLRPAPGRATEKDVVRIEAREDRLYELIDGVLVEKVMGAKESLVAMELGYHLKSFLVKKPLGVVLGEAGMLQLRPRLVRIPDVSFISWDQIPSGEFPTEPVPNLFPDLAVEVLSRNNTAAEMKLKVSEYFDAGSRLVWIIDPETHTAQVYTAPDECRRLKATQFLDGGDVLPGFKLPLKELFTTKRPR
ncbi:MAG TPA: Uma2 family endonuclease [Planctomycetaceae bacterium]|nr:Uma2 family endonuclease [Planctomycetaceae bacterium]